MKRTTLTFLIAALTAVLFFGFTRTNDDPITKILTQLGKWADTHPPEKVYLHLDKPFYAAGEDIWFKAYITLGPKHQLSALSNILHVELIDDQDAVKQSLKLPVDNGVAIGDFALQDTLPAGNYRIRAYTNYMRNAGEDYFFDQTIAIGNSVTNNVFSKADYQLATNTDKPQISAAITFTDLNGATYANKEASFEIRTNMKSTARGKGITDANGVLHISFANNNPNLLTSGQLVTTLKYAEKKTASQTLPIRLGTGKPDVQFFPEGGSLINGIRSKIAYKAIGSDGLGLAIKGTVKDNEGNEVARFTNPHFGMGYVVFAPQSGKKYTATVVYPDGTESTVPLPAATDKGYALMVTNIDPEKVTVRVTVSPDLVADNNTVTVVGQQNGAVCYTAKTQLTTASFAAAIPKSRFQSGIVQFTLFSATGEPLNERIVFIQNPDQLKLAVSTDKQTYAPRGKVKISVDAKDAAGNAAVGSFSAAVVDEGKVPVDANAESTIFSNLLLTSDLKGYIQKPNYYFANNSDQTRADLDVLMLTQGYRRFIWKQILNDELAQAFQPEKSITVTGTIKTMGGKPIPGGKVMLVGTTGDMLLLDTVADDKGRFLFKDLAFTDSMKFVIQARNAKDRKNVLIDLDPISLPAVPKNKNAPDLQVSINTIMSNYLQNSKKQFNEEQKLGLGNHVTALKEVVIKDTKPKVPEYSANLMGPGHADQVILASELGAGCATLAQCLSGKVTGVMFDSQGRAVRVGQGSISSTAFLTIVVDGVPADPGFLTEINPNDVASVEVIRTGGGKIMYDAPFGVLVITTKRGADVSYTRQSPGIITYMPKGFYKARAFYMSGYDKPNAKTLSADLRTTICWKPNIITDKDGNASFEFFNADSKGTYKIIVEGIDGNGNLGRQVYRYKVE